MVIGYFWLSRNFCTWCTQHFLASLLFPCCLVCIFEISASLVEQARFY